jgi:hypothetical protein
VTTATNQELFYTFTGLGAKISRVNSHLRTFEEGSIFTTHNRLSSDERTELVIPASSQILQFQQVQQACHTLHWKIMAFTVENLLYSGIQTKNRVHKNIQHYRT